MPRGVTSLPESDRGASRRRRSPACRSTTGRCSRRPSRRSARSRRSGWPSWPASTPPRCARTSPTSGPTAPAASGTTSSTCCYQISRELGLTQDWPVVIVGVGNLGHALANYRGFAARGLPRRRPRRRRPGQGAARRSATSPSSRIDDLPGIVAERDVAIGIIATPARGGPGGGRPARRRRRHVDPQLRPDGGRPCRDGVSLRKVDLAIELQILCFYQQRRDGAAGRAGDRAGGAALERRHDGRRADSYPVNLALAGRRCVVVGGGPHRRPQGRGACSTPAPGRTSSPPTVAPRSRALGRRPG